VGREEAPAVSLHLWPHDLAIGAGNRQVLDLLEGDPLEAALIELHPGKLVACNRPRGLEEEHEPVGLALVGPLGHDPDEPKVPVVERDPRLLVNLAQGAAMRVLAAAHIELAADG
jgi:hypothetical protein